MRSVLRIALIMVALAILAVLGSAAVLLALLDDDDYRRLASYLVERATGRTMIVDGRFALDVSLEPSLVMSQVRITNPPWASQPDLARIGHLEVKIQALPLLSRTLVVQRLILNDTTVALERSADGDENWTSSPNSDEDGIVGRFVPVFGSVRLRNVDWSYRDDASGYATSVTLAHLTVAEAGTISELDGQGTWEGQQIAAKGTLGTLAEALHPTSPFPVDVSASLPGIDLGVRGTIAEPASGRGLDVHLSGQSEDVAGFLKLLGSDLPLAGRLKGEAKLSGDFDAVRVADLQLGIAEGTGAQQPGLQVKGGIDSISSGAEPLLDGIALRVDGRTSTAALATWIGHELPDVGPVEGGFVLGGTSDALKISELTLETGAGDFSARATGAIEQIRRTPELSVQGVDLHVEATTNDLEALGQSVGLPLPALGAVSYAGVLAGASDQWTLSGQARLGETVIDETFTGSLAGAPPRLSGELSLSVPGAQLVTRGTVADAAQGQGMDLHVVARSDDIASIMGLLGHQAPAAGQLAGEATLSGDVGSMRIADLDLSLNEAQSRSGQPAMRITGQIASVTPGGAPLLEGIALQVQGAPSSAALARWLGRPLPEVGALEVRFLLSGTSKALQIAGLDLHASGEDGLRIDATGGVKALALAPALTVRDADLRLRVEVPDPSVIDASWGASLAPLRPLSYAGRLSGGSDSWGLSGEAQVGATAIDGSLTGSLQGPRPRVSGALSVPVLHLADFGLVSDEAPREAGGDWLASLRATGMLEKVDLALDVDIGRVDGTRLAIGRGAVKLAIEDGVLRIDPARFDFVAGTALLHATADARMEPPQIDLSLHADDVQLGEFLLAMGREAPITGELALIAKLQGQGDSASQLVASLGGEVDIAIQRGEVAIKDLNFATADVMTWLLAGADRETGLLGGTTASGRTKLECLVGRFEIERGVATVQTLLLQTPLTLSTATGSLDLVKQTVDLQVRLKPRKAAFSLARSYRVHGPMADASVDYSTAGFAAHTIEGLILTPIDALGSLLFPLVSDGGKDKTNPCLS